MGQVLQVSWERVRVVLEAKRSGSDPHSEASRVGAAQKKAPTAPETCGTAVKFLCWKDGVSEWNRVVRALKLEREIGVTLWDRVSQATRFGSKKAEAVFQVGDERQATGATAYVNQAMQETHLPLRGICGMWGHIRMTPY